MNFKVLVWLTGNTGDLCLTETGMNSPSIGLSEFRFVFIKIVEHFDCWASVLDIFKEIEVGWTIAVDETKILGIKARITLLFQSRLVKNLPKNCAAWSEFFLCLLKLLLSWFSRFHCCCGCTKLTTQNLFLILLNISPEKKLIWCHVTKLVSTGTHSGAH